MKNKILTISIIFILISFTFINNCFATSDTYNVIGTNDIKYTISSNISNFIIADFYGTEYYVLIYSSDDTTTWKITQLNDTYKTTSIINSSGTFNIIKINKSNTDFSTGSVETWNNKTITIYQDIIYSSNDIYDLAGNGIFFQGAPVTVLTPILEKMEMKEPIVTTVVGLAKLLIPLLICLVGFWKAWRLLSKILYKS